MSYKKQISLMSQVVFSLGEQDRSQLDGVVLRSDLKNMDAYWSNLLYGFTSKFKKDLQGVHSHLGDSNFTFLVREFILERGLVTHSYKLNLRGFFEFLKFYEQTHDDDFLISLCELDYFWSFGFKDHKELNILKEVLCSWLGEDVDCESSLLTVKVNDDGNKKELSIITSFD